MLAVLGLLVFAPVASADDLLILNGDSVTLSGNQSYGLVYIDGDLRLAGNTSITAGSIYIGPNANVISCFVAGTGDNGCTAGRSLNLSTSGPLTVATGLDLTAGSGTVQPGGSLTLSGSPVVVTGQVNTAGAGGGSSGAVTVNSGGSLAIGQIYAPGAPVALHAPGAIDVGGNIDTEGTGSIAAPSPAQAQSAGSVTIASTGGDVRIDGSVYAYGLNASNPGPLGGGNGAPVTISGANLRTGAIDTTGGNGVNAPAGSSAPIKLTASGSLTALGRVDASGQSSTAGSAGAGQPITLSAAGGLVAAGGIFSRGGQSNFGGWGGGPVSLSGATVTTDQVDVSGGGAPSSGLYNAGAAGTIAINAPGGASLGSLLAHGGNAYSGGGAGAGGSISVTSASGSVSTSTATTQGGYTGNGAGTNGGPITLSAAQNLTIGTVQTDGSDANGSSTPPRAGGNAGNLTLRALTGALSIEGNASATGGRGGSNSGSGVGGPGGNGGQIEVVAHGIGPVASLSSAGGDGGDYGANQGPGGHGGAIFAWTDGPLFNNQQLVSADGGNGNPTGIGGGLHQDSSPSGLSVQPETGLLSFTSHSPDASGYVVLASEKGLASQTVLHTNLTANLHPRVPVCVRVSFTVVAVNGAEQWISDPSNSVSYVRQPSSRQRCSQAPRLVVAGKPHASLARLRRSGWTATVRVRSNGIGSVLGVLGSSGHGHRRHGLKNTGSTLQISRPRSLKLHLLIPVRDRQPGSYVIRVHTVSPNGRGHGTSALRLQITP